MLFSFSSLSTLQNLSALAFHSLGLFLVTFYAFDGWSYNGLLTIFLITGLPPVLIEIILISKEICHKRYKATSEASVYSNHIQKCCTPGNENDVLVILFMTKNLQHFTILLNTLQFAEKIKILNSTEYP